MPISAVRRGARRWRGAGGREGSLLRGRHRTSGVRRDRFGHMSCVASADVSQPQSVPNRGRELRRDWELQLLDLARIRAWERVLFVACGDGWIVEEAWRRALKGYACGLDTSPDLVARATELREVPGRLEFKTWDGNRFPCPSHSFDRVISTFALEHCADPTSLLGEMRRVLHPGGDLYLLELQRDTAAGGESATAGLAAALHRAGFAESYELVRRMAADWCGGVTDVIIRARGVTPQVDGRVPAQPAA
jgi:ubiquinone/menaquinone biosynthesis C-methylase UbiE